MHLIQKSLLIIFCIFKTFVAHSQVLEPEKPKKATIQVENTVKVSPTQINNNPQINFNEFYNIPDPTSNYFEEIMNEVEQHQAKPNYQQNQLSTEEIYELNASKIHKIETNYWNALNSISEMLQGNEPLDLKKAVFMVEQAFLPSLSYSEFDKRIKQSAEICLLKMSQDGLDMRNEFALNLTIQKVMSDTVKVKLPGQEKPITSYPLIYDFNDPFGENDFANMFVSKLLYTKSGQCHSLPLLYLIIALELNVEANLAFSPQHSYIKFKDQHGNWLNYETTCGYIVSDNSIMRSGFISSMAIKNKIFMDTISKKETVAYCLNDLAQGYYKLCGFGNGEFLSKCSDLSLQYFPDKNLGAYMIKSNLSQAVFLSAAENKGVKNFEEAIQDEELKKLWNIHDLYYKLVQEKGYSSISKDAYLKWLNSLKQENSGKTNEELYLKLKQEIKEVHE